MKKTNLIWIIPLILIFLILSLRIILPREIDDVTPGIACEREYLEKADVLWVIPKFNDTPILENKIWCEKIGLLNKKIGLHGYTHTYKEFKEKNITKKEFEEAINIFEQCFGFKPTMFKPPQLALNSENKELIKLYNLEIKSWINQIIHKVYHCEGNGSKKFGGIIPNKIIDLL
jgi:predicted deacetylase